MSQKNCVYECGGGQNLWYARFNEVAQRFPREKGKDMNTYTDKMREAYHLGRSRGECDRAEGRDNPTPLSGEWAGESIPELLGDLVRDADDAYFVELCDEYERGYFEVNPYTYEG